MRRTTTLLCILLLALGGLAPGASGQFFQCFGPDDDEPIIFDFEVRPSVFPTMSEDPLEVVGDVFDHPPTEVGTLVRAQVWDIPNRDPENQHNGIVRVRLTLDFGETFEMQPEDGRYGSVREPVRVVIPPPVISPGVHTLTVTANDACGNTHSRDFRVYQYTFLLTGTCENAPRGFC